MTVEVEERLENIEHLGHLREDQCTVCPGLQPPQQHVHRLQFSYIATHATLATWSLTNDHLVVSNKANDINNNNNNHFKPLSTFLNFFPPSFLRGKEKK